MFQPAQVQDPESRWDFAGMVRNALRRRDEQRRQAAEMLLRQQGRNDELQRQAAEMDLKQRNADRMDSAEARRQMLDEQKFAHYKAQDDMARRKEIMAQRPGMLGDIGDPTKLESTLGILGLPYQKQELPDPNLPPLEAPTAPTEPEAPAFPVGPYEWATAEAPKPAAFEGPVPTPEIARSAESRRIADGIANGAPELTEEQMRQQIAAAGETASTQQADRDRYEAELAAYPANKKAIEEKSIDKFIDKEFEEDEYRRQMATYPGRKAQYEEDKAVYDSEKKRREAVQGARYAYNVQLPGGGNMTLDPQSAEAEAKIQNQRRAQKFGEDFELSAVPHMEGKQPDFVRQYVPFIQQYIANGMGDKESRDLLIKFKMMDEDQKQQALARAFQRDMQRERLDSAAKIAAGHDAAKMQAAAMKAAAKGGEGEKRDVRAESLDLREYGTAQKLMDDFQNRFDLKTTYKQLRSLREGNWQAVKGKPLEQQNALFNLAKAANGSGVLTDRDRAALAGAPGIGATISSWLENKATGEVGPEQLAMIRQTFKDLLAQKEAHRKAVHQAFVSQFGSHPHIIRFLAAGKGDEAGHQVYNDYQKAYFGSAEPHSSASKAKPAEVAPKGNALQNASQVSQLKELLQRNKLSPEVAEKVKAKIAELGGRNERR